MAVQYVADLPSRTSLADLGDVRCRARMTRHRHRYRFTEGQVVKMKDRSQTHLRRCLNNLLCAIAMTCSLPGSISVSSLVFAQETTPQETKPPATAAAEAANATTQPADQPPFPDLTIPANADLDALSEVLRRAKAAVPRSPDQYKQMQTAIRDAAKLQVQKLKGTDNPKMLQQAELDVIAASVALMTYFNEKQQAEVVEQLHQFLKGRTKLSLQDLQTGMFAASMLELQPNKKPSRDTYQLMDDLLKDDEREEMQNLRINLQAAVRRLNLLGEKFALEATAMNGEKVNIEQLAGKFVVVDFFATWCEPCLSEIPRLKKHYEKYQNKGLEVIGISLDGDEEALGEFLKRAELPWPVIHDNAEKLQDRIQMKFGVSSLPTVLLLNKEGTVVSLEARGAELDRLMDMLFEAPTPAPAPKTDNP